MRASELAKVADPEAALCWTRPDGVTEAFYGADKLIASYGDVELTYMAPILIGGEPFVEIRF